MKRHINLEEVKRLYYEENLSTCAIATLLGVSTSGIGKRMTKAHLKLRTHSDAEKLAYGSGRKKLSMWKGGRRTNPSGYIQVLEHKHPRANKRTGYVLEHILVWERAHNRPLPPDWVIHHLNGIRSDNRPCNLVALPRAKHTKRELAGYYKKRIRELEIESAQLRKALENNQSIFYINEN